MRPKNVLHRRGRDAWWRGPTLVLLGGLLAASGGLTVAAGPAAASSAPKAAVSAMKPSVAKPVPGHKPKPVFTRQRPAPGHTFVPKPRSGRQIIQSPNTAFTVSLSGPSSVWSTQSATVTATTNMDVGPTPYWTKIFDFTTNSYVATCGSGTTCSVTFNFSTNFNIFHTFEAFVGDNSGSEPPGNLQASSNFITVEWQELDIQLLTSDFSTLPVGGTATLTATATSDVGPTPFFIEIFDATTGTLVADCGFGTACTTTVSQGVATTHSYVAYTSPFSSSLPPSGFLAQSFETPYITWTDTGDRISLTGPNFASGPVTYTATANIDVGPTPYFIEIFDETTGALLVDCGSGTTCSTQFFPSSGGDGQRLVAFISSFSTSIPPPNIQASSNIQESIQSIP